MVNGKLVPMGGSAYCDGNVCFGMGARGTSDPGKATCRACLVERDREQRREARRSIVDRIGELQEDELQEDE